MDAAFARRWHLVTGVVAVVALTVQLALVVSGAAVLVEDDPPSRVEGIYRFFAYFTIQSNLLVAVTSLLLARDEGRDGGRFRVLRVAALVGITVTGLVHFVLLRPLLDLDGLSWWCDKTLHLTVPVLTLFGWTFFGPRPRVHLREIVIALVWPLAWLGWTLAAGAATGWFPYPFLDYRAEGWEAVLSTSVWITLLFVALFALVRFLDRRLRPFPTTGAVSGRDPG